MPLTPDVVKAEYHVPSGTLRGTLQPQNYRRRIVKLTFTDGPAGAAFTLYRGYIVDDSTAMTTTLIGRRNSYDASQGGGSIELFANEAATLVWTGSGVTAASTATAAVVSEWGRN